MKFRKENKLKINTIDRGFDSYDFKLGDLFRGERATLGLSLMDVQRALKINVEIRPISIKELLSAFQPKLVSNLLKGKKKKLTS